MKNKKIIAIILPIFLILGAIGIVVIKESYSAADTATGGAGGKWYYIRRNMFSHYYVSNNGKERDGIQTASGTMLIKSGSRTSSTDGTAYAVYCAEQGANNSASSHSKVLLEKSDIKSSAKPILNVMMKYSYPYITISNLKAALKDESLGLSSAAYNEYDFDKLNAQEAMTATQAAIWNAMKATTKYNYGGKLPKISSRQSSFRVFGTINWQSCGGYHTGSGKYATILTSEEEEWYSESKCNKSGKFYQNVYQLNTDGNVKKRINTLIAWYANLYQKAPSTPQDIPNIVIQSSKYQISGDKLTLTVTITSEGKDYTIEFKNNAGKTVLAKQKVTGSSSGNTFTIENLPLTTTVVTANITVTGVNKNVYYYKGSGQDWIGVNSGNYSFQLPILNNGNGQIKVYKVANQNINVEVSYSNAETGDNKCGASGCLPEAQFILYSDDKETVIKEFTTTDESFTINNLADGTYYLYEEDPPYGYVKYDYTGANVDSEGYIKIVISNGNMASVVVNNDLIKVCFKKIDKVTKKVVDGAKLSVQDAEGSVYEVFTTSSQQDSYCLDDRQLQSGYYYLEEEETPRGFRQPDKVFKFAVGKFTDEDIVVDYEDEDIVSLANNNGVVVIENVPSTVITKSDLATGGCVQGAKLTVKNEGGDTVDEWTSSCEEGEDSHTLDLNPGKYTLIEETAPEGYATAESIEFEIDENGGVNTSLDMKDAPIEVCLQKVSGNNKNLAGAEFEIYNSDGNLYNKFTSGNTATCFQYMPIGKYTIKETKAPNGYKKLDKDVTIEVKDTSQTQTFEIENEVEVPKTSMNYSQYILIIASIFMIFGLGVIGYYVYKKQS